MVACFIFAAALSNLRKAQPATKPSEPKHPPVTPPTEPKASVPAKQPPKKTAGQASSEASAPSVPVNAQVVAVDDDAEETEAAAGETLEMVEVAGFGSIVAPPPPQADNWNSSSSSWQAYSHGHGYSDKAQKVVYLFNCQNPDCNTADY